MKTKLFLLASTIFLLSGVIFAGVPVDKRINKQAITNLISCLNSENSGVKNSAIYFAGEYRIEEVLLELMRILRSDAEEETKLLAAQSLYRLNNERAAYVLKSVSSEDPNIKVRNMCNLLYQSYLNNQSIETMLIKLY